MIDSAGQTVPNKSVVGKFEPQGEFFHKRAFTEWLHSATLTADVQDDGKIILCAITTVITLPAVASTKPEYGPYTFVNMGQESSLGISNVQITISPDSGDKIYGPDIAAVDDTDLVNTLATAKRGDLIRLVVANNTGWRVERLIGTWA